MQRVITGQLPYPPPPAPPPPPPLPTYLISGTVTDKGAAPGFSAGLEFTSLGTFFTAVSGSYGVLVTEGYSGTAMPHYTLGDFIPQVRIYINVLADASNQNYAYTAYPTFTITGTIARDGTLMYGIPVEFTSVGTFITNGSGLYVQLVLGGYTGTATPHYSAGSFTPANRVYTSLAVDALAQNYAFYVTQGTETVLLNRPGAFAIDFVAASTTGYIAVQDDLGVITIYNSNNQVTLDYLRLYCNVWPCFSATDAYNTGHLTLLSAAGTQGLAGSLDLTGLAYLQEVTVNNNPITDLTLTGCVQLSQITAFSCGLGATEVNAVLIQTDANGVLNGSLSLVSNAAPTGGGITAKSNLQGKGWFVDTD